MKKPTRYWKTHKDKPRNFFDLDVLTAYRKSSLSLKRMFDKRRQKRRVRKIFANKSGHAFAFSTAGNKD